MLVLDVEQSTPVVYCSRHGDISRSTDVLTSLAEGDDVSAIQFSLAVHNAIGGIYSIQTANNANLSAITASDEPLMPTLIEAYGLLQQNEKKVLCVIADRPLPEVYQQVELSNFPAYVLAFVMTAGDVISISQLGSDAVVSTEKGINQVISFANFLANGVNCIDTEHNKSGWKISRAC